MMSSITPYLYIPLATWVVAQGIKFVLALVRGEVNLRYLFASGGMPSVHSAVVCSLATVAFIDGGIASPLFGITGVVAAIVMYDSFGVRRSAGEQAKTINHLIDDLTASGKVRNIENYEHLREILGHKPIEVTVGALLGVILAVLFEYGKVGPRLQFLSYQPSLLLVKILAALGVFIIIAGYIWSVRLKKDQASKAVHSAATKVLLSNIVFGLLLFAVAFGAYQHISMIDNFLSIILVLGLGLTWDIYLAFFVVKPVRAKSTQPHHQRTNQWIAKAKKSKKK